MQPAKNIDIEWELKNHIDLVNNKIITRKLKIIFAITDTIIVASYIVKCLKINSMHWIVQNNFSVKSIIKHDVNSCIS